MSSGRLFISYSSEDEATVERIVAYLEAQGVPCWIASRDIPPRSIYAEAITQGVQDGDACAVIVSKAANSSKAVKRELELASHYDKPFIPIRIDNVEPAAGLDYYLRNTQWMDFRRHGDGALNRIVAHMKGDSAQTAVRIDAPATRPQVSPTQEISTEAKPDGVLKLIMGGALVGILFLVVWFIAASQNPTMR